MYRVFILHLNQLQSISRWRRFSSSRKSWKNDRVFASCTIDTLQTVRYGRHDAARLSRD